MSSGFPTGGFGFAGGNPLFGASASGQAPASPTPSFGFNSGAAQTPAFGSAAAQPVANAFDASPGAATQPLGFNFNPQAASFNPQQAAQQQPQLFGQSAPVQAGTSAPAGGFSFGGGAAGPQPGAASLQVALNKLTDMNACLVCVLPPGVTSGLLSCRRRSRSSSAQQGTARPRRQTASPHRPSPRRASGLAAALQLQHRGLQHSLRQDSAQP